VALSVSTTRTATFGSPATGTALESSELDHPDMGTAAVAAIELMRKFRRFM
jgi:hypothetical protein